MEGKLVQIMNINIPPCYRRRRELTMTEIMAPRPPRSEWSRLLDEYKEIGDLLSKEQRRPKCRITIVPLGETEPKQEVPPQKRRRK